MPVQIMELVIKAIVAESPQNAAASANGNHLSVSAQNKEAMVKQCVEEVLRVLKEKEER